VSKIPDLQVFAADKMAVGTLIETRTRSGIVLADKKEDDDPMANLWREIARRVGPVYNYKGLGTYIITKDSVGQYKLAVNTLKDAELRCLAGKDAVKYLSQYILERKRFDAEPRLIVKQYLWEDDGRLRSDLTDQTLPIAMHEARATIDLGNGTIRVLVPYPEPQEDHSSEIDRLLGIILGERRDTFKMFLAQMLFEDRVNIGGRPSLIFWGERGTGKGLIVESVIRSLMPQMCCPIPADWEKFNNFQRYKFVYLDESEKKELDLKAIYVLAKRLSGGKIDMVGGKVQEKEQSRMSNYFAAMSNDKPIHLSDMPTSERDNQWLAIKFRNKLDNNRDFLEFREKHGANLEHFVKAGAGAYIRDVLLPLYADFAPRYRRSHRYGFPIPISWDLRELCEMAETQGDTAFWGILQDLEGLSYDDLRQLVIDRRYPLTVVDHFEMYQRTGFISSNLINFFNLIRGTQRDLTMKKARDIIRKAKIESTSGQSYASIKGASCRGIRIDRDKYRAFLEKGMEEDALPNPFSDAEISFEPNQL